MQFTEKFIEIDAPLERVFDLFSNFENFPRWMRNIKDVHYSGRGLTRWTARAPLGSEVEWEAETTIFQPDHKIAWRSVRGDLDTEGEVIFEESRYGTTLVHVVLGYDLPAGRLGSMVAHLFSKNPEQELEEDLERFAAVAEGRRPIKPQYADEKRREEDDRPSPPSRPSRDDRRGGRSRDAYIYDGKEVRPYEHGEGHPRDREERPDRPDEREERRSRGRVGSRFEEELRAARRSQLESARRYREERELDEQRRDRAERDERVRRADERERRRFYADAPPRQDEAPRRDERPHRHALTPRERARERERREPDYSYSEKAFSRGIDKLYDDPPSTRWRR
ncbi:MAG: SRPBCC family protein [Acidobacteria bacterium]|nr:SRPBCC family protein [Acidobacteriota bacterium]